MANEPDWTQQDPTKEQVEIWLQQRIRAGKQLSAEAYAWDAFLHFARPYHLDVLRSMATRIMAEVQEHG